MGNSSREQKKYLIGQILMCLVQAPKILLRATRTSAVSSSGSIRGKSLNAQGSGSPLPYSTQVILAFKLLLFPRMNAKTFLFPILLAASLIRAAQSHTFSLTVTLRSKFTQNSTPGIYHMLSPLFLVFVDQNFGHASLTKGWRVHISWQHLNS